MTGRICSRNAPCHWQWRFVFFWIKLPEARGNILEQIEKETVD
jgi:hypothetical protein